MNWIAIAVIGVGSGFFYWLGLRDARARISGTAAGARATGILLFTGIALTAGAGSYGLGGAVLAALYLLGWFRARRQVAASR